MNAIAFFQDYIFLLINVFLVAFLSLQKIKIVNQAVQFLKKNLFAAGLIFLLLQFVMLLFLGEHCAIRPHDIFDGTFSFFVALAKNINFLIVDPMVTIDALMGGIPRGCLPSSLQITTLLFVFLSPAYAYIINLFFIQVIAFAGMYLFLRSHIEQLQDLEYIMVGVSLCFAMLPFFPFFGIGIAGQPLLLYAFLTILKKRQQLFHCIIILLFPFYSSLYFAGIFFIPTLLGIFFFDWYQKKQLNRTFILLLLLFCILYVIVDYQLIYLTCCTKDYVSHRIDFNWVGFGERNIGAIIALIVRQLLHGPSHAASYPFYIIRMVSPFALIAAYVGNIKVSLVKYVLGAMFFISCLYGLNRWVPFLEFKKSFFLLNVCTWDRFYFFFPFMYYLLFALFLYLISTIKDVGKIIACSFILLQLHSILNDDLFKNNTHIFLQKCFNKRATDKKILTFDAYFPTKIFYEIATYIGLPQETYRVVSLGLEPAVPQYFGFYTYDGYAVSYPLMHKRAFRKIIEKELDKNPGLKNYFDNWGCRCYLFSSELWENPQTLFIEHLEINTQELINVGVTHIFSSVEIRNHKNNHLSFCKVFKDSRAHWEIYLYKILVDTF